MRDFQILSLKRCTNTEVPNQHKKIVGLEKKFQFAIKKKKNFWKVNK